MAFGDRKKKKYRDFSEDINGEIVYNGELFRYGVDNILSYSDFRKRGVALSAAGVISAVSAGTFAAPGTTDRFYIVLPLLAAIIISVATLYFVSGVLKRGEILRKFDIDGKLSRSKATSMFASFFSAVTFVFYISNYMMEGCGEYSMLSAAAFPLLILLSLYSEYSIFVLLKNTVWDKQKKN